MSFAVLSTSVEKEYYVQVDGLITNEAIEALQLGVEIGIQEKKYTTQPCKAQKIEPPTLPERAKKLSNVTDQPLGFRSPLPKVSPSKKMTAAVGFPTLLGALSRDLMTIENMQAGEVEEVHTLKH